MRRRTIAAKRLTLLTGLVLVLWIPLSTGSSGKRTKRSLVQFGRTVECMVIGRTAQQLFKMINCHGCWCGLGGVGEPVDELDNCCKLHDKCYDNLKEQEICNRLTGEVYWRQYDFDCLSMGGMDTIDEIGGFQRYPRCNNDTTNVCGQGLCLCDIEYAKCVQQLNITDFTRKPCPTVRLCVQSAGPTDLSRILLPDQDSPTFGFIDSW